MVDDLIGKQEVVIKSLGSSFRNIAGIAGGAILGDGHVGLILDLTDIVRGKPRCMVDRARPHTRVETR